MKYSDDLLVKSVLLSDADSPVEIGANLVKKWLSNPEIFALDDDETGDADS